VCGRNLRHAPNDSSYGSPATVYALPTSEVAFGVPYQATEAIRGVDRQLEAAEKSRREQLQEADDVRKRTRQERLRQLRAAAARRPLEALLSNNAATAG
jgi:acetyl-CoA carboxylase carboxyltransferase component